ncbi:A disintegrin and metalloproteinase with thrombospondin motifs 9-like [Haliotis asinina]|uniref:A disintegrin and metalloproteinase with thrombospondin motifs 9-like n=1 Tax=Haliotis asinina TaxID=109174 RepID=UPI003531D72A
MIRVINCRIHSMCLLFITLVGANEKTCSSMSHLPVTEGSRLKGAVIEKFTTPGIVSCAKECLLRSMCKSYNFQLDDRTCELSSEDESAVGSSSLETAPGFVFSESEDWPQGILGVCKDHSCPNNSVCREADDGAVKCVLAYCRAPPTVEYLDPSVIKQFTKINESLKCQVGFVPCGNMTCKPDGTWTTMTCLPVSNCSDVRQISSSYTDGEYWLYPRQLDAVRVKVYCHAMNTTPSEYISLPTPYFMDAPSLQNYFCTGEIPNNSAWLGYFIFSKFGLIIETMEVKPTDRVFYNKTTSLDALVGEVRDCYALSDSSCGRRGRAVMDLRGTGLALNETVTWRQNGGVPIVTRSSNNQVIEIRCGGWCGHCYTNGNARLTVFESDAPSEDSAVTPSCNI